MKTFDLMKGAVFIREKKRKAATQARPLLRRMMLYEVVVEEDASTVLREGSLYWPVGMNPDT